MRLLIYGFGPYRHFQDNVTEKILRRLPRRSGLKKIVFPVKFHKGQFIHAIKEHKPDVVLGLGQCSGGQWLRIETQAVNKRRHRREEKARPIIPGGPPRLRTNFKLNLGRQGKSSNNAGDYVCNYSMYVSAVSCPRVLASFTSLTDMITTRRFGFWRGPLPRLKRLGDTLLYSLSPPGFLMHHCARACEHRGHVPITWYAVLKTRSFP
jgi:hypothetical protein